MFRSKNWDLIKSQGIKAKVLYTEADLDLTVTDQLIPNAKTTVVVIENEESRYVGVAQCGPRDEYNRNKGREIAAGRALKMLTRHVENPNLNPSDVWQTSLDLGAEKAIIYGDIPLSLDDDPGLDTVIFGRSFAE